MPAEVAYLYRNQEVIIHKGKVLRQKILTVD